MSTSIAVEQLQSFDLSHTFYPNVTHNDVEITDFYRKNKPYRLLTSPGHSSVSMTFGLSGADNISKVIIELNHRSSSAGCVDLYLNDSRLVQNVVAPKDRFMRDSFQYQADKFTPEGNRLTVLLSEKSPGTYWLSDVTVYVKRIPSKTEAEIDSSGRQLLVHVRKLMLEREKLTSTMRQLAGDLGELQDVVDIYKAGKKEVKQEAEASSNDAVVKKQDSAIDSSSEAEATRGKGLTNGTSYAQDVGNAEVQQGQNGDGIKINNTTKTSQKGNNGTNEECKVKNGQEIISSTQPGNDNQSKQPINSLANDNVAEDNDAEGPLNINHDHTSSEPMKCSANLMLLGRATLAKLSSTTGCSIQASKQDGYYAVMVSGAESRNSEGVGNGDLVGAPEEACFEDVVNGGAVNGGAVNCRSDIGGSVNDGSVNDESVNSGSVKSGSVNADDDVSTNFTNETNDSGVDVADETAAIWEEIKELDLITEMEKMAKEDRKCRNTINSCAGSLKKMVAVKEQAYRGKYPDISHATSFEVLGYRFAQLFSSGQILRGSLLYQSQFKYLSKTIECISLPVMMKLMYGAPERLDAHFTFADLMYKMVPFTRDGSPRALGERLMQAADAVDKEMLHLKHFMNDNLTTLLRQLNEDLKLCNVRNVIFRLKQLPIFDQFKAQQGFLDMTWLNTWTRYEFPLPLPQLTSLANALNIIYHRLHQEREQRNGKENNREGDHQKKQQQQECDDDDDDKTNTADIIDLVIVANGSIGLPVVPDSEVTFPILTKENLIPSNLMFSTDHLSSVMFYSPWGTQIDASTFYGIIKGTIQPDQTRFLGHSTNIKAKKALPKSLASFNTVPSDCTTLLPTVWCNAFEEKDPALEQLTLLIECDGNKPKRPFIWWRFGSMPSFMLAALTSIAAMILSQSANRCQVRLHHGQCLVWPSASKTPPVPLMQLQQYHNVVKEMYPHPPCLTITPLL